MLEINAPVGNIFLDKELGDKNFERLCVSRMELERRILRRRTDRGTDVALNLDPGIMLQNGDVISDEDVMIVIEQLPEKVISVRPRDRNRVDVTVLLGHIIGNRHRPISIQNGEVIFPIQADSELEIFTRLFDGIINHIEIKVEEQIFVPISGADVHEH